MVDGFTKIGDLLPAKIGDIKNLPVRRSLATEKYCPICKSKMLAIEEPPHLGIDKKTNTWVQSISWKYVCPKNCEEKEKIRNEYKERFQVAKKIWTNVGFSRECVGWTLQKMSCENIEFLREYAANFNRFSKALVLKGFKGTGKTLSSECIAKVLVKKGLRVKITNMTEINIGMNAALWKNNFEEHINSLLNYDLLIIDDFGREQYTTEKSLENVFYFFNKLTKNCKPFIVSVNPEMLTLIADKPQLDACLDRFKKSSRVKVLSFKNKSFRN